MALRDIEGRELMDLVDQFDRTGWERSQKKAPTGLQEDNDSWICWT